MDILKVTFKNVNNAACIVYSAMSQSSPIVGTLTTGMCGGVFYCYTDATDNMNRPSGYSGFYKLYNPNSYGLNITEGFVIVNGNTNIDSSSMVDSESIPKEITNTRPMMRTAIARNGDEKDTNIATPRPFIPVSAPKSQVVSSGYSDIQTAMTLIHSRFNTPMDTKLYENMHDHNLRAFNMHKIAIPGTNLTKAFPRVFFTRPDIHMRSDRYDKKNNIINPGALDVKDPWFTYMDKNDPLLLQLLTKNYTPKHDFNPFLSNESKSFDLSDEKLETMDHGETFTGWKVKYGKHTIGSKTSGSFTISYDETHKLEIYKMHKAWIDYISKVFRGELQPNDTHMRDMVLDYACSVYYFLCAEDGETVIFWSKYTGVFPTSIPSGQFDWSENEIIKNPKCSIEYDYAWKEDMNPLILTDFNKNAHMYDANAKDVNANAAYKSMYVKDSNSGLDKNYYTFAGRPFISIQRESRYSDGYNIKLRFSPETI